MSITETLRGLAQHQMAETVCCPPAMVVALLDVAEAAREMREATANYVRVTEAEDAAGYFTQAWHIASAAELNATARLDEALEALAKVDG